MYILSAHNSWSYATPKKWWMKLIRFTAKCQKFDIKTQYEKYNVKCFDLRVRFDENQTPIIAHGLIEYDISPAQLTSDLMWLDSKKDVCVRVLLEVRTESAYTENNINAFKKFCASLETYYQNIKFWCGRNLYNWNVDYKFNYEPTCEEKYSSVCPPKIIDDWFPWMFAKLHNHDILEEGTDKDILMIDFVNIQ